MMDSLFKRCRLWLMLLVTPAAFSDVYLAGAPTFAEINHAITLHAFDDDAPDAVTVTWQSDSAQGTEPMTWTPTADCWTAVLPGSAAQGTELNLTVTADYGPDAQPSQADCTIYLAEPFTTLRPQPLELKQTILTQKKWNSGNQAFGLLKPENGPPAGPASIAAYDGRIYLLDSVNNRVLTFDKTGRSQTAATIPSSLASDLVIDPSDGSVLVVAQLEDNVYRFKNGILDQTQTVTMKKNFGYPAKFTYDPGSNRMYGRKQVLREKLAAAQDPNDLSGKTYTELKTPPVITDVQDSELLVKTDTNPAVFAVTFDEPVGYIDEAVVDDHGVVWVLFTLRGDYRVRRLMRIDTQSERAETADIDVWFAFDATRRMTVTDSGVALMAGDTVHGRIVMFDYAGDF